VRCSFLQVDPSQADRLAVIETDLHTRIETAREQEWLGDIEQLQITLKHLHDKQDQVLRLLEIMQSPPLITTAPALSRHQGSIVKRIPNMIVVPAHDQRAFADMAELPNVTTKGLIL
jgi:hypothetical protein